MPTPPSIIYTVTYTTGNEVFQESYDVASEEGRDALSSAVIGATGNNVAEINITKS